MIKALTWPALAALGIFATASIAEPSAPAQIPARAQAQAQAGRPTADPATSDDAQRCSAMASHALPHADISEAVLMPADGGRAAYCRVRGSTHPVADSAIGFEVMLPVQSGWNGRYLQVGNGGLAGSIPEKQMMAGLAQGFAVAGTDDGHSAHEFDGRWAVGHPEKRTDFAYRALKETTDAAKAILAAYYGRPASYSYFQGCSAGGREALMEAQRFPEDFNGIVSGAPAAHWTHLAALGPWAYQAVSRGGWLSEDDLLMVQTAARAACGADSDGVITNPIQCRFDPAVLRCSPRRRDKCLSNGQIAALRRIYGGINDARTGKQIIAGYSPGGEAEEGGWSKWTMGSTPDGRGGLSNVLTRQLVGNVLLGGAPFNIETFDSSRNIAQLDDAYGDQVNAIDPNLEAFRRRGGKLIHFHGWYDQAIPTRASIAYYRSVQRQMGDTAAFYRLFLAPGMLHCSGGPGPNVLATLPAIVEWVEHGKAPDSILATKYRSNDVGQGVKLTRPICRFPQVATWSGKGDRDRAENYACTNK